MTRNQAYTEAFRDGMHAACNRMKRADACLVALALPTRQGDAFLAGYYAEIRQLNADAETRAMAESDPAADRGDWEFHRDHDQ